MVTKASKLKDKQRRKMFALARSMGWNIDALRDIVWVKTGQRHISALTTIGGDMVLKELERLAREARTLRQAQGMAQPRPKQVAKIYKLGYLLRWKSTTIRRFNRRTTGKWDIYENTPGEASKLIMAMEGVLESEKQRRGHGQYT